MDSLEGVPIVIKRVDVVFLEEKKKEGNVNRWLDWLRRPARTSNKVLETVIQEPLYGAHTDFKSFYRRGESVAQDLGALGCHDMNAFEMELEPFNDEKKPLAGEPLECVCRVSIKENKRIGLGAKLSAEGESAVGETELKMTNYFGSLERISGSVAGTQGQTTYNLSVERPLLIPNDASLFSVFFKKKPLEISSQDGNNGPRFGKHMVRFGLGNTHNDNRALSSHSTDEASFWASIVSDEHAFTYECTYRDVQLARTATLEMLQEGGQSVKNALRYTFSRDSRDHRLIPSTGRHARFSVEGAGLLGDVNHVKVEAEYNRNFSLGPRKDSLLLGSTKADSTGQRAFAQSMTFHVTARTGALFSGFGKHGGNGGRSSFIADRFFFGGLNNPFYGFKLHGAGPRLEHDSYGGDYYWTTSIHSHAPLIATPVGNIYAHAYTQAGNCVSTKDVRKLFSTDDASSPIRCTTGAGITIATAVGLRFDALYSVHLSRGAQDLPQNFSFGASFNFG